MKQSNGNGGSHLVEERCRILLVEDDETDRMAFLRMVERESLPYDCVVSSSVKHATHILREQMEAFDVIVSDFNLGDGDVFEILENSVETPLIVITGAGDQEVAVSTMKRGASDYLVKDINGYYLRKLPVAILNAVNLQKTAELLEESERRYRYIVDTANDGIWITNEADYVTFVNPKMAEMLGLDVSEIVGSPVLRFMSAENAAFFRNSEEASWRRDISFYRKDGRRMYGMMSSTPIIRHGRFAGTLSVVMDITERKQSEELFVAAILEGEEQERKRLARELHDGLGQLLSGMKLHVCALKSGSKLPAGSLSSLRSVSELAMKEYRAIAHNLLPPLLDENGLVQALDAFCETASGMFNMSVMFKSQITETTLSKPEELHLFRIAQELLFNALKHSTGDKVVLSLSLQFEKLVLVVGDNGQPHKPDGVPRRRGGLGMKSIEARIKLLNGEFSITTSELLGTEATVIIPTSHTEIAHPPPIQLTSFS